jgi:hypothetical protein
MRIPVQVAQSATMPLRKENANTTMNSGRRKRYTKGRCAKARQSRTTPARAIYKLRSNPSGAIRGRPETLLSTPHLRLHLDLQSCEYILLYGREKSSRYYSLQRSKPLDESPKSATFPRTELPFPLLPLPSAPSLASHLGSFQVKEGRDLNSTAPPTPPTDSQSPSEQIAHICHSGTVEPNAQTSAFSESSLSSFQIRPLSDIASPDAEQSSLDRPGPSVASMEEDDDDFLARAFENEPHLRASRDSHHSSSRKSARSNNKAIACRERSGRKLKQPDRR